jgi:SMI1/KNR4 family protein SUKH-1
MIDPERIAQSGTTYPPAGTVEIRAAEAAIGLTFPPEYAELLRCSNGLEPRTERYAIALFRAEELGVMNEAYEVRQYLPGFLLIGTDGRGQGIFLDCNREPGRIYLAETGALGSVEPRLIASSLGEWIAGGFDLGDLVRSEPPEWVDIFLVRPPNDGLRGLARILEMLDQTLPVSRYRDVLSQVPYRLARGVSYLRYGWRCAEYNLNDPCLGAFEVDRPDRPVPVSPRTPPSA